MRRFSIIHYLAILVIISSLGINYIFYHNTGHFDSPIIAFEFAQNSNDILSLFMDNDKLKSDELKGVNEQNVIDYLYMVIYSALLFTVFLKIKKISGKRIYIVGLICSIIALFADFFENLQMLKISNHLVSGGDFSNIIPALRTFTWIKWLSISLSLFLLSIHYFKYRFIGKLFSILTSVPIILGLVALFNLSKDELIFTTFVMLGFVLIIIWSFISYKFNRKISFYKL